MSERRELRILGHTELRLPGNRTGSAVLRRPKQVALLAYLALAASDGFRRRDQIVALFWPEKDQLHARTQLRKTLYALRGMLGAEAFLARGEDELRLNADRVWCDAVAFRRACDARDWPAALDLYHGDLLEALHPQGVAQEFDLWLEEQRAALREQASRAAWEMSTMADLAGNREAAMQMARRAAELSPDDEESVRRLIGALDRYGDRAGAMRVFTAWQERLRREFDADPAPETRKLARHVRAERKGESAETSWQVPTAQWEEHMAAATPATPPVAPTATPPATRPTSKRRVSRMAVYVTAGLVALATIGFSVTRVLAAAPTASVAVLPFRHVGDSLPPGFGDSMAEEITTQLAAVPGITVRSAFATRDLVRRAAGAPELRALRSVHVIEGSIVRERERVRVRVRIVRADDDLTIWGRSLDVSPDDFVRSQERVASETVAAFTGIMSAARN